MKSFFTIVLIFYSCISQALTGNELHEMFEKNDKAGYVRYIQGIMDTQAFIATAVRSNKEFGAMPTICPPSGSTYGQGVDLIKKYLYEHPESRNNPAPLIAHNALVTVWRCPAE
ncbi:MAG TPA: Rap1a/Tai family immunity protein [Methylotenera sp.]|nr:Rap1a/Tai family immunity protein [Methylotenera sp.]